MNEQPRWSPRGLLPTITGVLWLYAFAQVGAGAFLLGLPVGLALAGSGLSRLMWPGDPRIEQTQALAALLGVLLFPLWWFGVGFGAAGLLAVLCVASFVNAGFSSIDQEPFIAGVPRPEVDWKCAAWVGVDETILGFEQLKVGIPMDGTPQRLAREVAEARTFYGDLGYLDDPEKFHVQPPALEAPRIERRRFRGLEFDHVSFESGYAPHSGEPGRERWLSHDRLRTAHAYVLRHAGDERPWLVCNGGYRMGHTFSDIGAFGWLYEKLGLNLLMPVLPMHGPRRLGAQSGDGFFSGDVLDMIHAEAQAMWDIRRLIGWLRGQGADRIGTFGLSLGGYTTALLAGLESGLACAIPGIPVADFSRIFWRHGPRRQLDYLASIGLGPDDAREALRVVSPLAVKPKVPREGRLIFAATADRLVPPDQPRDLWRHWDEPRIVWYHGSHVSFITEKDVQREIGNVLATTGLIEAPPGET